MDVREGLRERKKRFTRAAIADAALRLVLAQGLDRLTVEGIAREAFVSPRTVANYFASKEAAVLAAGEDEIAAILAQVAARDISEPPLAAIRAAFVEFASAATQEQLRQSVQRLELAQAFPALRPFYSAQYILLEEGLRSDAARRTDKDPARDIYPWLVAASASGVLRSTMTLLATGRPTRQRFQSLLEEAFRLVQAGLAPPMETQHAS